MSDPNVENYKKNVARIMDTWAKAADSIGKELAPINAELDKLQANKSPSPDDKKKIDELKKKCVALHQKMDNASATMRINLMVIDLPPYADEKELVKLPGWLKDIIKAKGIPLGHGVSIAPDVSFDFKAKKLKSFGITIRW